MKKVLLHCPNYLDGVSFYRSFGPLSALEKQDRIRLTINPQTYEDVSNYSYFVTHDLAHMSRPYRALDLAFANQCKRYDLPLWIDFDDDIWEIEKDNPAYELFSNLEAREMYRQCLQMADVITVGHQAMKEKLISMGFKAKIEIIQTALDDRLIKFAKPFNPNSQNVAWRGSKSHLADLLAYQVPIQAGVDYAPHLLWHFFGIQPWFIKRVESSSFPSLFDFTKQFCEWNAKIMIIPLRDTPFNRARGLGLGWIDGTLSGSVCLSPNLPEWNKIGMVHYKIDDLHSFEYNLIKLIDSPVRVKQELWQNSFHWIKSNLMLSQWNEKRIELINQF